MSGIKIVGLILNDFWLILGIMTFNDWHYFGLVSKLLLIDCSVSFDTSCRAFGSYFVNELVEGYYTISVEVEFLSNTSSILIWDEEATAFHQQADLIFCYYATARQVYDLVSVIYIKVGVPWKVLS